MVAALALLVLAGRTAWTLTSDLSEQPMLDLLDVLLLVFIVVELLFAVRTTVEKRELVAEPFLVIGVIASIKEIVVLSVEAAGVVGEGAVFRDRITEIAVLGVLVLLLGATSWLLRRKEREPDEGEGGEQQPARARNEEARVAGTSPIVRRCAGARPVGASSVRATDAPRASGSRR